MLHPSLMRLTAYCPKSKLASLANLNEIDTATFLSLDTCSRIICQQHQR